MKNVLARLLGYVAVFVIVMVATIGFRTFQSKGLKLVNTGGTNSGISATIGANGNTRLIGKIENTSSKTRTNVVITFDLTGPSGSGFTTATATIDEIGPGETKSYTATGNVGMATNVGFKFKSISCD